jgi:hypothetical protein
MKLGTPTEQVTKPLDHVPVDLEERDPAPRLEVRSGSSIPERVRRVATSSIALGAVVAAITWPAHPSLVPQPGLDESWMAGMHMAARHGVPFGSHAVYTYGPLGFLATWQHLFYGITTLATFLFAFAMATAVYAVLIRAIRVRSSLLTAVAVALVAGSPLLYVWTSSGEPLLSLVFVACIALLGSRPQQDPPLGLYAVVGSVLAICLLVKVGVGLGALALCGITIVGAQRLARRAWAALGASFVAVFSVAWFVTGNGFGNLFAYAKAAWAESSGYSAAMYAKTAYNVSIPGRHYDWWFVAIGCTTLAVIVYRWCVRDHNRNLGGRSRVAIPVATMLIAYVLFKEGAVRHNEVVFFSSLPLLVAAFVPWRWHAPTNRINGSTAIAAMLVSAFVAYGFGGGVPMHLFQPVEGVRGLASEAGSILSPSRRNTIIANARANAQAAYSLPASMVAATAGQTVAIDPYEQMVAWAYPRMRWDPFPVMQHFEAYTPSLDRLDRDFLRSDGAPRFIIRQYSTETVDTRVPIFDPPATQVEIACRYREVEISGIWQLLERSANRCHDMQLIGSVRTEYGKLVTVPQAPPGTALVATFDLHLPLSWRLLDIVYKPPGLNIELNGAGKENRFIAKTAGMPHLLRSASTLGYSPKFTAPAIDSFMLTMTGQPTRGTRIDVKFFAIPMDS